MPAVVAAGIRIDGGHKTIFRGNSPQHVLVIRPLRLSSTPILKQFHIYPDVALPGFVLGDLLGLAVCRYHTRSIRWVCR